jgi:hypothetical protein
MYEMSLTRKATDWVNAKNRARNRPSSRCKVCGIEWTQLYLSKLEPGQYKTTCSLNCTRELQRTVGHNAMLKLWIDPAKMKEISSKAGRKSAAVTVRRSKDEIKLFELCSDIVLADHNKVLVNGWDADIVIDKYKIAIMWNGPWHYKEMKHKNHSLVQVQNRDRIKIKQITECGYTVFVFEDREYTPETAFRVIQKFIAGECESSTLGS